MLLSLLKAVVIVLAVTMRVTIAMTTGTILGYRASHQNQDFFSY